MNIKYLTASALALVISTGTVAPALADGAASTRNILLGGAAAAVVITNINHKKRIKAQEQRDAQARRQAYRNSYYRQHGRWPS